MRFFFHYFITSRKRNGDTAGSLLNSVHFWLQKHSVNFSSKMFRKMGHLVSITSNNRWNLNQRITCDFQRTWQPCLKNDDMKHTEILSNNLKLFKLQNTECTVTLWETPAISGTSQFASNKHLSANQTSNQIATSITSLCSPEELIAVIKAQKHFNIVRIGKWICQLLVWLC